MGKLRDYVPALKYGNKIYPNDIAGMIGQPHVGNIYYVDAGNGSDNAGGTSQEDAFATVGTAVSALTADQDDVVVVAGESSTGRTTEASAVDWSKRRTHLVGNGPLRKINPRNGMSFSDLSGDVCFTVSATNCSFKNITIASFTDNNILVDVTAAYNNFDFIHAQGMGIQAAADDAAARSFRITGADETEVSNSTIGLDTVTRGAANASLELTGTCARTKFLGCDFPIFTDAASPFWVKADTGNCYERFLEFNGCNFYNPDGASSTTMTAGFDLSTTGNGDIYFLNSWWRGATDLANNYDRFFTNNNVVDTANQGLVIVNAT